MVKNKIISLGGSLIVPNKIDITFLKKFKNIIEKRKETFHIICGGGKTARDYIKAASKFTKKTDYVGIKSTLLNAELMKALFPKSHKTILTKAKKVKEKIIIYSGNEPNHSSDFDAVEIASKFKNAEVINLTNVDYVYDKNPKLFKTAKPFNKISWKEFKKICGNKWTPGLNLPFDPIGSKLAEKNNIKVIILNGNNLKNFENYLNGKTFKGTIIE